MQLKRFKQNRPVNFNKHKIVSSHKKKVLSTQKFYFSEENLEHILNIHLLLHLHFVCTAMVQKDKCRIHDDSEA